MLGIRPGDDGILFLVLVDGVVVDFGDLRGGLLGAAMLPGRVPFLKTFGLLLFLGVYLGLSGAIRSLCLRVAIEPSGRFVRIVVVRRKTPVSSSYLSSISFVTALLSEFDDLEDGFVGDFVTVLGFLFLLLLSLIMILLVGFIGFIGDVT